MKITRTYVSDATASKRTAARMREEAETNPAAALAMATALAANPSLLDGLGAIVSRLATHDEAASILDDVFKRHGKKYPATYRAYMKVRLGVKS